MKVGNLTSAMLEVALEEPNVTSACVGPWSNRHRHKYRQFAFAQRSVVPGVLFFRYERLVGPLHSPADGALP
jgi:hypothetical protein